MPATELLASLYTRGLSIRAEGDSLIVQPRELLTDELRAAIRANKPAILAELAAANDARLDAPADPDGERQRDRAMVLLAANPNWRRVVVAEAGDPVILGVAIRGVAYGEVQIPAAKYDAAALMALLDQYGQAVQ